MWYKHVMESYSTLKREKILTHLAIWMDLEDIMLKEISQAQKNKYFLTQLTRGIYVL